MGKRMVMWLPDSVVAWLDRRVASGEAANRAAFVTAALEREMRRRAAEHDAKTLREAGPEDDLDDLVEWTAAREPR
ncbi:hypothetical protein [Sinomonas halotolerans]|uniref:CopG family transcriptional regulator n=1 Tax=Sinomonas halotolerans TaxID=1644133 RepID=A0ABU9WZW5_9MICC